MFKTTFTLIRGHCVLCGLEPPGPNPQLYQIELETCDPTADYREHPELFGFKLTSSEAQSGACLDCLRDLAITLYREVYKIDHKGW